MLKRYTPKPAKQMDYVPRPRAVSVAAAPARMTVPVPKSAYVRDTRLRDMCRAMACQYCGASGPGAGVTWAHSNQSKHGKGRSIKASDIYVAALCHTCHAWVDQGGGTHAVIVSVWDQAHAKTIETATRDGIWPSDIPQPGKGE